MTTQVEEQTTTSIVGARMKRVEDPRMITGAAKYLDDLKLPGMAYGAVLRSPYAHARIKGIDTQKSAAHPGVIGVYTGKDFEHLNPLPCAWQASGADNFVATPRALEIDRVTFTGAGVAAVVAETRAAAEDALSLIEVDWEPLEVVVDPERAVEEGAPQLHEAAERNIVMDWECGDPSATDKALGEAEVVVEQRLVNQRLLPTPIEPRGAAAQYEPSSGEYTVWMTSQAPHVMRLLMTAFVFGIPETKMRCISPQVGGGFGTKIFLYPEYVLVAALAEKTGRPVKWMETRSENYTATTHGRDHVTYLKVGAKRDGTITALKAKTYANLGGILSTIAPRIPNIHCQVLGVYTNTGMVDAYRGAGRPEATYVVERAVDLVARELDLDPVEVRRRNFIPPDAFPYDPVGILAGLEYDSGDYEKALTRALEMVGYDEFRQEQAKAREEGRYLGIGFSTYVEICGVAPSAWIGTGGQGWGAGLWESAAVGVVAVYNALQRIKAKARRLAAHMLEVDVDDVEFEGGRAFVKGSPATAKTIQEIAAAAAVGYDLPPGEEPFLDDTSYYDENGQLLTSSLMEYAVPKADVFPQIELDRTETPTDVNPLGVKGAGETGTIASTPAVVNAVVDALAPLGIEHIDMPLTPERVWRAMREARS